MIEAGLAGSELLPNVRTDNYARSPGSALDVRLVVISSTTGHLSREQVDDCSLLESVPLLLLEMKSVIAPCFGMKLNLT